MGPLKINELAAAMGMDRTTLGRNLLPLERDGLISVGQGQADLRSSFGPKRSAELRALMGAVVQTELI